MRHATMLAAAAGALFTLAGASAQAMPSPAAPAGDGLIEHVADGCGPGFFRGRRGFCRPMDRGYGPPRGYGGYGPRGYGPPRYDGPPRFYGGPRYFPY